MTFCLVSAAFPLMASENIVVVIGGGIPGGPNPPVGDGGPPLAALLESPCGIIFDAADNAYVVDQNNNRIRKVTKATGIITTIAGTGEFGFSGDLPMPATLAKLAKPSSIAFNQLGDLLITDQYNHRIRKVVIATGLMTTIAGSGAANESYLGKHTGDNFPAIFAELNQPEYLVVAPNDDIYFSDMQNARICKISGGIITTIAGDAIPRSSAGYGIYGFSGDGGLATSAKFNLPTCLRLDTTGNIYVADCANSRIRKFSIGGNISTIAGGGAPSANAGDGNAATLANLYYPTSMVHDAAGNLFIADQGNHRIRRVDHGPGSIITTVAGTGVPGFAGNAGPAISAQMNAPTGVAFDNAGHLYTTERNLNMIRTLVGPVLPVITWVPQSEIYGVGLGFNQLNATTSVPGTFTYTPAAGVVLPAGTSSLQTTFTPADAITYSESTTNANVMITPASLVVVVDDQVKVQGATNPLLTFHLTGLVNGEAASVVTGSPALTTTATTGSAAGTYPITVDISGMSAANYVISVTPASLTISASPTPPTPPTPPPSSGNGSSKCGLGSGLAALMASVALFVFARSMRSVPRAAE